MTKKISTSDDGPSVPLPSPKTFPRLEEAGSILLSRIFKPRNRGGKDKKHHIENPLKYAYYFLGQKPFSGYHLFLATLAAALCLGTNIANARIRNIAFTSSTDITIEQKAEFASKVDTYTPALQEDPTSIVLAQALEASSGYYSLPVIAGTATTEEPAAPVIETEANRTKTVNYVVKEGDTLSTIGWEFGLKIATIQFQNKISGEGIKAGQKLTLPPGDVSAAVIAKAKAKEQAEQKKKLLASSSTGSRRLTTREKASGYTGNDSGGGFVRPTNYGYISRRLQRGHTGTDMVEPVGTTVVAAKAGRVVEVSYGWSGGYGIMVLIDHGGGLKTRYAHLSNAKVSAGEIVGAGEVIAASGNTGRSTGPHLHFEVIRNGRYESPF